MSRSADFIRSIVLAGVGIATAAAIAGATTISLTVTSPDTAGRTLDPVVSGVPIAIADTSSSVKWTLFDGATPIRVQTKVLHGRKTPWLLLGFNATVAAGASKTYQLVSQTPPGFSGDSVAFSSQNGGTRWRVNTGPLRVDIARDTFNLFREVWVNGTRVTSFDTRDHLPLTTADGSVYVGRRVTNAASMIWETQGPLRATLRVDGFYASAAAPTDTLLRFTTRMTFYAGQTYVDVQHVVRNSVRPRETYVKVRSCRLLCLNGTAAIPTASRPFRAGRPMWMAATSGSFALETVPDSMRLNLVPMKQSGLAVDANGGMVVADWSYHATEARCEFNVSSQTTSIRNGRISRFQNRLFALAPATWYSTMGAFGSDNFGTYDDEQTANTQWGWARPNTTPSPNGINYQACSDLHALARPDSTYFPNWANFTPGNDTEADELWSHLMMFVRVQQRTYLDRAAMWARYQKYEYAWRTDGFHFQENEYWAGPNRLDRSPMNLRGGTYSHADSMFINYTAHPDSANTYAGGKATGSHSWNAGLLDWYYMTGDIDAKDAAVDVAEQSRLYVIWRPVTDMGGTNIRADARNYMNSQRLYEANSEAFWGGSAALAQQRVLQANSYDARGFYGEPTNGMSDTIRVRYPNGKYVSPFQMGAMVQAIYRGWVATGNDTLRQRLLKIAEFAYNFGANPDSMFTGDDMVMDFPAANRAAHLSFNNFRFGTMPWDSYPSSSRAFVDALTIGYRLDPTKLCYLTRARTLWERVSKFELTRPTGGSILTALRIADATHMGRFQNSLQCSETQGLLIYPYQGGDLPSTQFFFHDAIAAPFDYTPPAAVVDLGAVSGETSAIVSWTAPGDDGAGGGAAEEYDLRYSTSTITAANFEQATPYPVAAPAAPGTPECAAVSGLTGCNVQYWFALRTRDECGWSGISNVPGVITRCVGGDLLCDNGLISRPDLENASDLPRVVEFGLRGQNPLAGPTAIALGIPANRGGERLEVGIFDVAGRRVRTLADGPARVGRTVLTWDLRSEDGSRVRSGAYYLSMRLGAEHRVKKMVLVQ